MLPSILPWIINQAHELTGIERPVSAGKELIRKGLRTKWVIIKMGAKGSMLITSSTISRAPAFKVYCLFSFFLVEYLQDQDIFFRRSLLFVEISYLTYLSKH